MTIHKRRRLWAWHKANIQPRQSKQPWKCLIRFQWFNKMNGRQFDEWRMCQWTGMAWAIFSGALVVEWRAV